jgi:hypothetical protein
MLFFFDETFRTCRREPKRPFGALCGVGIQENALSTIAEEIFQIKRRVMGREFAEEGEIKGKEVFKKWVFNLAKKGETSRNLELGHSLLALLRKRGIPVFGSVCFDPNFAKFQVDDVSALDSTFFYLFERIDMWMKIYQPGQKALLVFDDRDFGINHKNAAAITRFFQRSHHGNKLDSIVQTPFFAISQSHNVGLQLADLITTVIGLRFEGCDDILPYFQTLKSSIPNLELENGTRASGLKIMRDGQFTGRYRHKKAPSGLEGPRSGQESPTLGARQV